MLFDSNNLPSRCFVDDLPKAEEVADFLLARLRADSFDVNCVRHDCVWSLFKS